MLIFDAPGSQEPEPAVNLRFSIEGGRAGLDWVLLAPQNLRDQDRFSHLAREHGHRVAVRETNEVSYLRVEDGDLAQLSLAVMQELYGLSLSDTAELLVGGLEWEFTSGPVGESTAAVSCAS